MISRIQCFADVALGGGGPPPEEMAFGAGGSETPSLAVGVRSWLGGHESKGG